MHNAHGILESVPRPPGLETVCLVLLVCLVFVETCWVSLQFGEFNVITVRAVVSRYLFLVVVGQCQCLTPRDSLSSLSSLSSPRWFRDWFIHSSSHPWVKRSFLFLQAATLLSQMSHCHARPSGPLPLIRIVNIVSPTWLLYKTLYHCAAPALL